MNQLSEARLAEVHPRLADKIRTLADMILQESYELRVTQGFRTWSQQHTLWLRGRAPLAEVNLAFFKAGWAALTDHENFKVTNADAGYSWHNYGLAVDVAPFKDAVPDWNERDTIWMKIVNAGESLGLRSGISWKDEPHFEYTGVYGPEPTDDVRTLYLAANDNGSGSQAVWDAAQLSV